DVAEPVQDLRHLERDRGLARARVAGEGHVQRRPLGGEADVAAELVHEQEGGDLADARLDRPERDQLAVELVEHLHDVRLVEDGAEVGALARRGSRSVRLLLVDVRLLGLVDRRGRGRPPHAELEAHAPSAAFPSTWTPRASTRPFACGAGCTSRWRWTRPGPWIRSSVNGRSTEGRLTMNASAVVCRV